MGNKTEAWRAAFDERHQFDVYPDDFMTGMRNEFCAGWYAAMKTGQPKALTADAQPVALPPLPRHWTVDDNGIHLLYTEAQMREYAALVLRSAPLN